MLLLSTASSTVIFKPETLVRWHRSGFRLYWRWKSRRQVGRPLVPAEIRDLVRTISRENPLWGAPRIHGELQKLGIDIAQSTVAKYMPRRRGPPGPDWRTFLRNHATHIAAIDISSIRRSGSAFCTAWSSCLEQRRLVWANVTANPTAEWITRQVTEAFPWEEGRNISFATVTGRMCSRHTSAANHGHSRPADNATLALAER